MRDVRAISVAAALIGQSALFWRSQAEMMERERNQAFADLAAANATIEALKADLAATAELLLREQDRTAAQAVVLSQYRAGLAARAEELIPVNSFDDVPAFTSEAEEAAYWGTHGLGQPLLDQMKPMGGAAGSEEE